MGISLLKNLLKCLCCIADSEKVNQDNKKSTPAQKQQSEKNTKHHKNASITLTKDDWEEDETTENENTIMSDSQSTIIGGKDVIIWEADTAN